MNNAEHSKVLAKNRKRDVIMRSAVITAPRKIELFTLPAPEPDADEVRVRLEGCGLCASDMPVWQGREWFSYPMEPGRPGHEGWGIVDAVGEDIKTIQPGYRVATLGQKAYAEYDLVKENQIVELPEIFHGKPFPGEPLACAMNIFRRSRIKKGMTVAIVGTGWIGLLLVQLAKKVNADIIAVSRRSSSLKKAKEYGAAHTFSMFEGENIIENVEELTRGNFCDCVIEAAGKQESLDLAGKITGIRGRLVIAGYHQDEKRTVNMQLWNWRGIDVVNAHERDRSEYIKGMREAVKHVSMGVLKPFPLFTHSFPLEHIQDAFETHEQKPENFTKALISFE